MNAMRPMKVWIDGRVVDADEARVPVVDHGLLYGDGVFEGIRVYGRRVFRLEDHLARLTVSARAIGLEIPGGIDAVRAIVLATACEFAAQGAEDAYVRLLVTRGEGPLSVDPLRCPTPRIVCIVGDVALYPPEKLARGIDLVTVSVRRPPPDVLDPRVKSLNYLNNVMAIREARMRGADEALLLNAAGAVAEASGANVFVVRAGLLVTPPASDGALEGITRGTVMELADGLGFHATERTITRIDVLAADEAFLTGTGARIVPVCSLDGATIAARLQPVRPVTDSLIRAFDAHVRSHGVPITAAAAAPHEPGSVECA